MDRRKFLKTGVAGATGLMMAPGIKAATPSFKGRTVVISSGNGLRATAQAMELIRNGSDALDAVIAGVNIVEADPDDMSVGYGGLPNEEGVVELDSCCMHGPTHNAGAVAALQGIKYPSRVARLVMERTDHVLLVGQGALRFAKAHGFKEENLLTDKARKAWLRWKEARPDDDWFPPEDVDKDKKGKAALDIPFTYGTITCLGLDLNGNISGVTTTSGLSYKIPGRVGDSPIIGAGLYVDNEVGACGSTGRGEENLKNLTSHLIVEFMRQGMTPQNACMAGLKRVLEKARLMPRLMKKNGHPAFNIQYYAINKAGEFGACSMYGPVRFAVHDGQENHHQQAEYLFEWDKKTR
ncbi:MAG: asparaginase [Calditrichaeota bacterium]|nr:MAG: asparaginase [Calditrichota bacterium]